VHELVESTLPDKVDNDKILVKMISAPIHSCDKLSAMGLVDGVNLPAIGGTEAIKIIEKVTKNDANPI
jgi:hypothetical protein